MKEAIDQKLQACEAAGTDSPWNQLVAGTGGPCGLGIGSQGTWVGQSGDARARSGISCGPTYRGCGPRWP